ncbi:hypothetical protein [Shewanella waksmanii]|uniref:hypothetical protein n=1 Tax=Shewanella waksmanii TaxID=213783 RepID=UPI0037353CFA
MKSEIILFFERNPIRSYETEDIYINRITEIAISEKLDLMGFFSTLNDKFPQRWKLIAELSDKQLDNK